MFLTYNGHVKYRKAHSWYNYKLLSFVTFHIRLNLLTINFLTHQNRRQLYRDQVDPSAGGKVPESYKFREKLNQVSIRILFITI